MRLVAGAVLAVSLLAGCVEARDYTEDDLPAAGGGAGDASVESSDAPVDESAADGATPADASTDESAEASADAAADVQADASDAATDADAAVGGPCNAGDRTCTGLVPLTCNASGHWESGPSCPYLCTAGWCAGECTPGAKQCSSQTPQSCDATGHWQTGTTCVAPGTCGGGTCMCATWTQRSPPVSPPVRQGAALAYDEARQRVVLFGGYSASPYTYLSETWEWDGTTWAQRFPAMSPPGRYNHALAYDSARQRMVLFGGSSAISVYPAATWEYDGTTWVQQATSGPAGREYSALAFNRQRGVTVMFGGRNGGNSTLLADTWEWNGTVWTERHPSAPPVARAGQALAFDSARARTVMMGGSICSGAVDTCYEPSTWQWDGTNWQQTQPTPSPGVRAMLGLAYDSARHQTVLFGGWDATNAQLSHTWEWDGAAWAQRSATPSPVSWSTTSLAYDSARHTTVLFRGTTTTSAAGTTWEYAYGACP